MSTINRKKVPLADSTKHLNWMGGAAYDVNDPVVRLRMAASSCFFGEPTYYHTDGTEAPARRPFALSDSDLQDLRETLDAVDPREWRSLSPAQMMEKSIDAALDADPERTLIEAARLRNEEHMRVTPQVILVRAAHHSKVRGTGLLSAFAPRIIRRLDEPATGLAYHIARYGKDAPVPNGLKRAWRKELESATEWQLAKYKMGSREVKTVDVVNLVHPRGEHINKLVRGELTTVDQTWESIISKEGSTKETWAKAVDVMGHMGLLRNLRNLHEKAVDPAFYLDKLVDGAPNGKQFPFRYYSAYQAVKEVGAPGKVLDGVEKCLSISLANVPALQGRVMSLCDNSGSAQGTTTSSMGTMKVSTIANLTGIIAGMRSDDGHVGIFGDRLETFSVRAGSSVFDQLDKAENIAGSIGQNTENGIWLFWDKAIREKQHWDHVFVMSDMQAGHGGLYGTNVNDYAAYVWNDGRHISVAKLVNEYRRRVNPKVNVFLVQVAGYKDTILPEFYNRTYILGGWGEGVLRFAAEMAKLNNPATTLQQ